MKSKKKIFKRNLKLSRKHIKTKKRTKNIVTQKGGKIQIHSTNEFGELDTYTNDLLNELKKNNISLNQILCMKIYLDILIIITYTNLYLFEYLLNTNSIEIKYSDSKRIQNGELFSSLQISGRDNINLFYVSGKFEIYKIDYPDNKLVKIFNLTDIFKLQNTGLISVSNPFSRDTFTLSVLLNRSMYSIEIFDTFNPNLPNIDTEDIGYENIMFKTANKYLVQLVKNSNNRYALIFNDLRKLEKGYHREYVYDIISDHTDKVFDFKLYYHTNGILYIILLLDKGHSYDSSGIIKLEYNILDKENTVSLSPFTITDEASHIPLPINSIFIDFNFKILTIMINNNKLIIIDLPINRLKYLSWKIYEFPFNNKPIINLVNIVPSSIEYQDTYLVTFFNNLNITNVVLDNIIHQPDLCIKNDIKQLEYF